MGFDGFDIVKIRALAKDLGRQGEGAQGLHSSVAMVLTQANALMGSKPATTDPLLSPLVGDLLGPLPFFGGGNLPGSLGSELGDMSKSIERRCTQLEACNKLAEQGYRIDPIIAFSDEKPPDAKKIEDALRAMSELKGKDFGSNGNRDDLEKIQKRLDGLTSAELDAFFAKVPDADIRLYGKLASNENDGSWLKWWDHNGIPESARRDHLSGILAKISPAHWGKMKDAFPEIQPGFDTTDAWLDGQNAQSGQKAEGMHWGVPKDPLFTPGRELTAGEISQGRFGDCWYISSLTATAQRNPQFIREGIKENPNGTIDVRIWDKDGNQHWVTVTPDLPLDKDGEPMTAYNRVGHERWPAYYEKAFALMYGDDDGGAPDGHEGDKRYDRAERGNYGATEWDFNEHAPPYVTGHDSESIDNDFESVKETFESEKRPVIVSTPGGDQLKKDGNALWGKTFSTRHVYYVKGFENGKIVLGNPWGPSYSDIKATPEEYKKFFNDPQALKVPR
ncbi:C2 family cysteine protease [Streptomyces roseoverticillatus]|uniref:C2 family cysteine protease n=1 Tax=Streptomyces roseoverticillatus TaxID=66429 RepID=A0ABV3IXA2_9ACTN